MNWREVGHIANDRRQMRLGVCLFLLTLAFGCTHHQTQPDNHVPAVLLAAFLDSRSLIEPGRRIVVGPFRLATGDTVPRQWTEGDLKQILADGSAKLGNPAIRGRTLEGRPLPWSPDSGDIGVSFSVPEFRGDTARVVTVVQGVTRSVDRLVLVRRAGRWVVIRRENILVS
jgi:hypothetical protein